MAVHIKRERRCVVGFMVISVSCLFWVHPKTMEQAIGREEKRIPAIKLACEAWRMAPFQRVMRFRFAVFSESNAASRAPKLGRE